MRYGLGASPHKEVSPSTGRAVFYVYHELDYTGLTALFEGYR
jgi:hypothetical protein